MIQHLGDTEAVHCDLSELVMFVVLVLVAQFIVETFP